MFDLWVNEIRPKTLLLAASNCAVGCFLGLYYGEISFYTIVLMLLIILTGVLLQIVSNLANDYGDACKGADGAARVGPIRAVMSGGLSLTQLRKGIGVAILLAVIVGAVAPGVSQVASNSDIEWKAPFTLDNTIVIAESADVRDYTKCMVIDLPANSKLREVANLQAHPDNVGETIKLKGKFTNVLGMVGIADNLGTSSDFVFSGTITVTTLEENFDSYGATISGLLATGWTSVKVKGNKEWFLKEFDSNTYASMTGYKGTAPFESWLITPAINVDNMTEKVFNFRTQVADYGSVNSKFEVYVLTSNDPTKATKTKVDAVLADPATATSTPYSEWANSGNIDLSGYTGKVYIGFCYSATQDAEYATWCLDDVKVGIRGEDAPNTGDRDGSAEKPYTVADVLTNVQGTGVWVKGYIVGYASSTVATDSAVFGVTGTVSKTNLLLADSADEKDVKNCISIALPIGGVRDALNLKENPGNLGKLLTIKGDLGTNLYIPGVKSPTEYKLGE